MHTYIRMMFSGAPLRQIGEKSRRPGWALRFCTVFAVLTCSPMFILIFFLPAPIAPYPAPCTFHTPGFTPAPVGADLFHSLRSPCVAAQSLS